MCSHLFVQIPFPIHILQCIPLLHTIHHSFNVWKKIEINNTLLTSLFSGFEKLLIKQNSF
uniref:Uncharacterized protein n=1 Tax=Rhizophora mucronata TaxID=61149 RepID=A0A2P2QPX0_RHIMU